MKWPSKDPDEVLDYAWTPTLDAGDHIVAHTAVVAVGSAVVESSDDTHTTVTVWLSGGIDGETAQITLTATTNDGRLLEETFTVEIVDSGTAFILSFKAMFPDFANVPNDTILLWFGQCPIDDRFGDKQDFASMLWVAHTLAGMGQGDSATAYGVTEMKSGTLSLKWEKGAGLASTAYGKQLAPLVRLYGGLASVTSTGTTCLTQ